MFKRLTDLLKPKAPEAPGQAVPPVAMQDDDDASTPIDPEQLEIVAMAFEGPMWGYGLRAPAWLLPAKPDDAKRVLFLSFAKAMGADEQAEKQRTDAVGQLTRALPLYLAEAVHEWTAHRSLTQIPIVPGGGPVVFGDGGRDEDTVAQAAEHGDYMVLGTIDDADERWRIQCRVWQVSPAKLLGIEEIDTTPEHLGADVLDLEQRVLSYFGPLHAQPHDALYRRMPGEAMGPYLTALAQHLLLSMLVSGQVTREDVWGERNMIEWPLHMALEWPQSPLPALLYLAGLSQSTRSASPVLLDFEQRTLHWWAKAGGVEPLSHLAPLVWRAFGMEELDRALAQCDATPAGDAYCDWLRRVAGVEAQG
ncbi:hypothetical protein LYSHEL_22940 [Lysobacter helvus]|uniref:DUF3445 domain-containing protein n=2 Tax=Lysobacteraceae TaxID=32033 RepID=A0ABM7Q7G4_9GAMM|nr:MULTISPECIES: hypothetical protein [Lysobacter]BCT93270.1 hypothetical protein LYSCAS_22940 [Lysobacter caseinilyticus]BCT96423.1 hypothetical protein LYSHEL_22940 [Lysobacter helvus]